MSSSTKITRTAACTIFLQNMTSYNYLQQLAGVKRHELLCFRTAICNYEKYFEVNTEHVLHHTVVTHIAVALRTTMYVDKLAIEYL